MIEIKNRYTGEVICTGETIEAAVLANLANFCGANLNGANFYRANFSRTNFCGANFYRANFNRANFSGANFSGAKFDGARFYRANFSGTKFNGANLNGANLNGANFCGANLNGANFDGAKLSWRSHDLISEILRRAAGDDIAKLKIAGLVLVCREKCWEDSINMRDPLFGWAIGELQEWSKDDENAPECVRESLKQPAPIA